MDYCRPAASTGQPPTHPASEPDPGAAGGPEPDSGYEASPASTAGHYTFDFDRRPFGSEDSLGSDMAVFLAGCSDPSDDDPVMLEMEELSVYRRLDDDGRVLSSSFSESRLTSPPIPIPRRRMSAHAGVSPVSGRRVGPSHLSWPTMALWDRPNPVLWPGDERLPRSRTVGTQTRRRSNSVETSSSSSSEGVPDNLAPSSAPLPDVLQQAPELMAANRARSVSVSLPLDARALANVTVVGRELRRLSDHFESRLGATT